MHSQPSTSLQARSSPAKRCPRKPLACRFDPNQLAHDTLSVYGMTTSLLDLANERSVPPRLKGQHNPLLLVSIGGTAGNVCAEFRADIKVANMYM